jgi:galactokinase/mevalonate kinase-like predicted kinase
VAKEILQEIVRGMFLNARERLDTLDDIGQNALLAAEAIECNDWDALGEAVKRSWFLNQRLDAGTNPISVQSILEPIADYLVGAKLLGAGGGGYLLMLAKDAESAHRIRRKLEEDPPNARARFVNFTLSDTGLQVTRS